MYSKPSLPFIVICFLTIFFACKVKTQPGQATRQAGNNDPNGVLLNLVLRLDEFKQVQSRADSITKVSNIPVNVSVDIMDSSFYEEDKGKNISLAFINENYSFDNRIIFTVKYDKDLKEIISVSKNYKERDLPDLTVPEDIPLPPNQ